MSVFSKALGPELAVLSSRARLCLDMLLGPVSRSSFTQPSQVRAGGPGSPLAPRVGSIVLAQLAQKTR
jgi:hypothetical protein